MALCGVLTALAAALLALGGLLPIATFCAPLLAMAVLLPVLEEYGPRMAGTAWAAVSLLGLFLSADRELALVYLFFGWYPILRPRIAALKSRALRLVCRLALCSGLIGLLYGVAAAFLGLKEIALEGGTALLTITLLVCGNLTFLLMDLALERLTLLWRHRLRRKLLRR